MEVIIMNKKLLSLLMVTSLFTPTQNTHASDKALGAATVVLGAAAVSGICYGAWCLYKKYVKPGPTATEQVVRTIAHQIVGNENLDQEIEDLTGATDVTVIQHIEGQGEVENPEGDYGNEPPRKTLLHHLAEEGENRAVARVFLNKKNKDDFRVDIVDYGGETPLIEAIKNQQVGTVKVLLNTGANINWKHERTGDTPLHYAVRFCFNNDAITIVKLLLNRAPLSINAQNEKGETPLHFVIKYNPSYTRDKVVELFLASPHLDISKKTFEDEEVPIHYATYYQRPSTLSILLKKYSKQVNAKNFNDITPLHIAAGRGDLLSMRILLNAGAKINAQSSSNEVPLHWAVAENKIEAVNYLLQRNAYVDSTDSLQQSPLHYAANNGNVDIINILVTNKNSETNKAIIDATDSLGDTPLHIAITSQQERAIEKLLELGANTNIKNKAGETPLDILPGDAFNFDILQGVRDRL